MTTYLVTRHEGTRIWVDAMAKHGRLPFTIDRKLEHLDSSLLIKGDVVVGTLPFNIAAELHAMGVEFWSLDLHVPPEDRGKELSGLHISKYSAHFTRYEVHRSGATNIKPKSPSKSGNPEPSITLIPVSDQLIPAAIGWLHSPTDQVCLMVSDIMKKKAKVLRKWFESHPCAPDIAIIPTNDASYAALLAQAEDWASRLIPESRPRVVVNLTGGTKPMSMALHRAFGQRAEAFGGRLSGPYVDTAHRQIEELLALDPTATPMRSVLNIADLLNLQGFEVKTPTSALPGYDRWLERGALFEILMSKSSERWRGSWYFLLSAADRLLKKSGTRKLTDRRFTLEWQGDQRAPTFVCTVTKQKDDGWDWKNLRKALEGAFGIALSQCGAVDVSINGDDNLQLVFQREPLDELAFLAGGWMEVWLATLFKQASVDDFAQGLEVKQESVKNEIDLVVACGNRLLLVEVKSGRLSGDGKDDTRAVEIVYKTNSNFANFARFFSERWLVSLTDIPQIDRDRAGNYRIKIFAGDNLKDLPKAIKDWTKSNHLERIPAREPSTLPA